ncbi:UNKNOWN [Stylonychia lemnae]|uniref:Uncharacterized protein n=1 Tax=Stylonychia lemnae TaxID=5949 RepID=A0A077ZS71_STYLE|nr:UNKNOWN [Stylonychia lemnae]|eukprot:CDW72354.1 UNKNOWN [Stylonychia lemnae]
MFCFGLRFLSKDQLFQNKTHQIEPIIVQYYGYQLTQELDYISNFVINTDDIIRLKIQINIQILTAVKLSTQQYVVFKVNIVKKMTLDAMKLAKKKAVFIGKRTESYREWKNRNYLQCIKGAEISTIVIPVVIDIEPFNGQTAAKQYAITPIIWCMYV